MPQVEYQGRMVDGDDVSFSVVREDWNTYQLHDGTELRMRLVVSQVFRLPDELDQEGNPVYVVKSGNLLVVKPPEVLPGSERAQR